MYVYQAGYILWHLQRTIPWWSPWLPWLPPFSGPEEAQTEFPQRRRRAAAPQAGGRGAERGDATAQGGHGEIRLSGPRGEATG